MLSQRENVNFKWINHNKSIFDNIGLSYVNLKLNIFIQTVQRMHISLYFYPKTYFAKNRKFLKLNIYLHIILKL